LLELTESEKKFLIETARKSIEFFFEKGKPLIPKTSTKKLKEKFACFVTLEKHGMLRGCIGNTVAVKPLIECIAINAVNAAFFDPRFMPLMKSELKEIEIEVSILSKPKKVSLDEIIEGKHGVILKNKGREATFLPQVWESLPNKELFLSELSLKAALPSNAWQEKETEFFVYEVIAFKESEIKKEEKKN